MSEQRLWLAEARRVIEEETDAISSAGRRIDERDLSRAITFLRDCKGRVVVTGMGKSGAIGRKFAGTLSSTGTPAFFLHPAEALHGDLGMLAPEDSVVAFSYSGETDELLAILPSVVRLKVPIISFTGRGASTLAAASDVIIDVSVDREACPMNLAPTTSTSVMLVLSDAVAMALMMARGFTQSDYAARHPAGTLGRRLLLRVSDLMRSGDAVAIVPMHVAFHQALFAITKAHAGAAIVVNEAGNIVGLVTDGDARRLLLQDLDVWNRPVEYAMNKSFGTIAPDMLAVESLRLLEQFHPTEGERVGEAPVVDSSGKPVGMLMLKDLVKAGLA